MSFDTQEQHASYGIGRQMADQLAQGPFPGFDREAALAGFTDALQGEESQVSAADINAAIRIHANIFIVFRAAIGIATNISLRGQAQKTIIPVRDQR